MDCCRKKFHNRWKAQAEALANEIGELEKNETNIVFDIMYHKAVEWWEIC